VSAVRERAVPELDAAAPLELHRRARLLEENGTLILVLCVFAIAVISHVRQGLVADGWMALLSGREIVQHGLPAHDTLTVWAHGRRWVDQQWLAQLFLYGAHRLGGLRLVLLVHALLASAGLAAAALLARGLGATARSVTWICVPVLVLYYPEAVVMRPQSLIYLLFVAVLALLLSDRERPSRRVYATLAILALWANLHGSVLLGAAMVSTYGVIELVGALKAARRPPTPRALVLTLAPWACVLASPYAARLPAYYEKILVGAHFGRYVTEWAPTTLSVRSAPLYLLVVVGAWLLGRARVRTSAFEVSLFLLAALLAVQAERNLVWFGLVAIVVLPRLLDAVRPAATEPRRLNRLVGTVALAGTLVTAASVALENNAWFVRGYPPAAAATAAAAAGSSGRIFANEAYADWLVWMHPDLAGRVAFDSRFELLTPRQLRSIAEFRGRVGNWQATAAGYDVLVLNANAEKKAVSALERSGSASQIAKHGGIAVLRRTHRTG
jgi:hypothetical protein